MTQYAYMPGGGILISTCPRSGSSMKMKIQETVHGPDMILGYEFPQEEGIKNMEKFLEELKKEDPVRYELQKYFFDRQKAEREAHIPKSQRDYHDMNPDGFWEMEFTVRGIRYTPRLRDVFKDFKQGKVKFCKVVSQGLLASDPIYIKKILYSIRHPRAVAKSQERLIRGFNYTDENGEVKNAFSDTVIHTPEMFINVTTMASQFFLLNPRIPVLFTHYEDLVSDPKPWIDRMGEFVGFGDYSKAYDVIKPKLNRSKHEEDDSPIWEDADFVYEHFCEAAELREKGSWAKAKKCYQDILNYMSDPGRETNKQQKNWPCPRAKQTVNYHICENCKSNPHAVENMKKHSVGKGGKFTKHWALEPCPYECGMQPNRDKYLTVTESRNNNDWITLSYESVPGIEIDASKMGQIREDLRDKLEMIPVFNDKTRAQQQFLDILTAAWIDGEKYMIKAVDTPEVDEVKEGEIILLFAVKMDDTYEESDKSVAKAGCGK